MKMSERSHQKNKDDKKTNGRVSMVLGTDAAVNVCCHNLFTGQVLANNKHVMRNPRVVPIMWGHYYISNPNVATLATQMISDLVTGPFRNGLAQYGVGRGSVLSPISIDTNPTMEPTSLDRGEIRDVLLSWLLDGTVSPAPAVGEQNLIYVIFLPTGSTITDAGAAGYHNHGKYNTNSSDDDLFWAVILTNSAPQTSSMNFVRSLGFIVSHELSEAFTDRDEKGFVVGIDCTSNGHTITDQCEIGDICETRKLFGNWSVEQYWSNWDTSCINGDQPVSVRRFLQAIGVDGAQGLRALRSAVINVDFVASRM